ncbi:hypothetical protein LY13_002409 [Prauserella aidingensis]|nr:hypothetical protein [Prauserella aidingensis]
MDRGRPCPAPRDRDAAGRGAEVPGDLGERRRHPFPNGRGAVAGCGQRPVVEDSPGGDGQPEFVGHGQDFALDVAVDQAVRHLHGFRPGPAVPVGDRVGPADRPRRHVGQADVPDLARADEVVERAQRLLDGRVRIPGVHPQDVDVVGAEPPEAALERRDEVLAVRPGGVGIAGITAEPELGGDHEPVASGDHLAEQALALAVRRRRVDDVAPGVGVGVDDAAGLRRVGQPHRAEEQFRDPQSCAAEQSISHTPTLVDRGDRREASTGPPS